MTTPRESTNLPLPVRRALRKLGQDMKDARLRRRIPASILADRASISQRTLINIEKGSPSVGMGNYASALFALGLIDRLADVAEPREDAVGMALEEERLPKRIRPSRRNTNRKDDGK